MTPCLVVAAVLYWLLGSNDREPSGSVEIGDDWTARFDPETGKWSDDYRLKDQGEIP